MAEDGHPAVFSIPLHRAFADALAGGLIARFGGDPLGLARGTILLPNNRAIRAMTDAFVRRSDKGLLLPRMVAIGDPGLDERLGSLLDPIGEDDEVPPAIDPLERLLILSRLVGTVRTRAGNPIGAAEAMRLAADLARTLDQLVTEGIDPQRLSRLIDPAVDPSLAEHWQTSLASLEAILSAWPGELAARGRIDLAERRNRLVERAARRWTEQPPVGFIVAAGISVAAPSVARLLRTISRLPSGLVVLAGLDGRMTGAAWDALGPHAPDPVSGARRPSIETHPQFQLKRLLDRMGVAREEVRVWRGDGGGTATTSPARTRSIWNAMMPAAFTGAWQGLSPAHRRLSGVRALELGSPAEEAQAIAVAMREALETPGRTAALVTPDRALALRVIAHLARWNIAADDSAGRPLSTAAPGTLLLALAEAAAQGFAPAVLLTVLKHPLVNGGGDRLAWLDGVRALDLALRGPRPPSGTAGIARYLAEGDDRARRVRIPAAHWWQEAVAPFEALEAAFVQQGSLSLARAIGALREAAAALAGDAAWSGPAGRQAADLVAQLEASREGPAALRPADVPMILRQLLDNISIRPPQGGHPRLFIWGLIEARLQQADLMILGGLNEGVWPSLPAPDPWLAPRIRADLGLPGLDRRIGVEANDFASGLAAREVLITRSRRDARSPAVASRLWLRLRAMTGGLAHAPRVKQWAECLDRPAGPATPAGRPAPSPPLNDRPRRIAVTKLDRLKADPFAFYADVMLRLHALDGIDAEPSPAWRGSAVHAVFEAWMKEDGCDPEKLGPRARVMLGSISAHPVLKTLWTPRLMEAIDWAAAEMAENQAAGRRPLVAEIFGEAEVGGITLYGKVDRIDRSADGTLAVVDYKTGKAPAPAAVSAGYAMQLGLLGLIAEKRGFAEARGVPTCFEYWSLAQHKGRLGHVSSPVGSKGIDPSDFTTMAARQLEGAASRWLLGGAPFVAKLHPEFAPYEEYDQLMRLDEWYGRTDG